MSTLKVSDRLLLCPICGSALSIEPPESENYTKCSKCTYVEMGGSAEYATLYGRLVQTYFEDNGINEFETGGIPMSVAEACAPDGLLPVIYECNQLTNQSIEAIGIKVSADMFRIQEDIGGLIGRRLVLKERVSIGRDENHKDIFTALNTTIGWVTEENLLSLKGNTFYTKNIPTIGPVLEAAVIDMVKDNSPAPSAGDLSAS